MVRFNVVVTFTVGKVRRKRTLRHQCSVSIHSNTAIGVASRCVCEGRPWWPWWSVWQASVFVKFTLAHTSYLAYQSTYHALHFEHPINRHARLLGVLADREGRAPCTASGHSINRHARLLGVLADRGERAPCTASGHSINRQHVALAWWSSAALPLPSVLQHTMYVGNSERPSTLERNAIDHTHGSASSGANA
jgi:hypothetical protein